MNYVRCHSLVSDVVARGCHIMLSNTNALMTFDNKVSPFYATKSELLGQSWSSHTNIICNTAIGVIQFCPYIERHHHKLKR